MSDLMNPVSTVSVLLKKDGTGGGKKASNSGKNDNRDDGARRIQKSAPQIEELGARLSDAETRREKKKLQEKIKRISRAGHRAKAGEAHSQRGKGRK